MKSYIALILLSVGAIDLIAMEANEQKLRKEWELLKKNESIRNGFCVTQRGFFHLQVLENEARIRDIKKELPQGRGDQIIKELEENYQPKEIHGKDD